MEQILQQQVDPQQYQQAMELINARFRSKNDLYRYLENHLVSSDPPTLSCSLVLLHPQEGLLHPPLSPAVPLGREAHAPPAGREPRLQGPSLARARRENDLALRYSVP